MHSSTISRYVLVFLPNTNIHGVNVSVQSEEGLKSALARDTKKRPTVITLAREPIITLHIEISTNIDSIVAELSAEKNRNVHPKIVAHLGIS